MKKKYGIKRKCAGQTYSEGLSQQQEIVLDLEVMGEDETSFQEHINAITLELRKSNPSYSEVKNRMKRTLFKRVQIMDRPAAEVMEQFPFLGVPQLMLHEMTMRFGTDLAKNMETSLNEMAPNIIRSAKKEVKKTSTQISLDQQRKPQRVSLGMLHSFYCQHYSKKMPLSSSVWIVHKFWTVSTAMYCH
ncbi:uncharacterized protein LOC127635634 isoform X2 [Xyrauchen texanus]|uniref:uncharacterized protein LOC127635634 isoform X2 n=1 Tax=Xyrauchen texanus TaxID=154827 RepID=UPI002242725A|nr:uncharacterized protein LOC127635634 isoform X2 [Xyrauchen texanus]